MWQPQNTILRIAMALMQPKEFICSIDVVRWVYANTSRYSTLRGFVGAIFCQRGSAITADILSLESDKAGIVRDAAAFLHILDRVRAGNSQGKDGYNLTQHFQMTYRTQPACPKTPE
jgi:hypothetical protein